MKILCSCWVVNTNKYSEYSITFNDTLNITIENITSTSTTTTTSTTSTTSTTTTISTASTISTTASATTSTNQSTPGMTVILWKTYKYTLNLLRHWIISFSKDKE